MMPGVEGVEDKFGDVRSALTLQGHLDGLNVSLQLALDFGQGRLNLLEATQHFGQGEAAGLGVVVEAGAAKGV